MSAPRTQYLVFTGLDGFVLDPEKPRLQDVQPALNLLHTLKIPLIITTDRTPEKVFPLLDSIGQSNPFIAESGAVIFIPENALKVQYTFQKTVRGYRVIQFGIERDVLLQKVAEIREKTGIGITALTEVHPDKSRREKDAATRKSLTVSRMQSARHREYSAPVILEGDAKTSEALSEALENMNMRLNQREDYFIVTGDYDKGTAVRFLVQLYREEFPDKEIKTIGLGENYLDTPMLHAVDQPVLIRNLNGKFDSQVGRRGLKFTCNPGPVGWNDAVISLLSEGDET